MQIEYRGERLEMGFNARYFIDTLQAMESEEIVLGFIDSSKPCILGGEADKGFLGLIMPMRL
jgi:DNA polymerase-3 subunit beta